MAASTTVLLPTVEESVKTLTAMLVSTLDVPKDIAIIMGWFLCNYLAHTQGNEKSRSSRPPPFGVGCTADPDDSYLVVGSISEDKDEETALHASELQAMAASGATIPIMRLATCYELGWELPRNWMEAFRWFRRAAESGGPDSLHARAYLSVWRPTPDPTMVVPMLETAVAAGSAVAMDVLVSIYEKGWFNTIPDPNRAADLIIRAANSGLIRARIRLSFFMDKGLGSRIPPDPKAAFSMGKELADMTGEVMALYNTGCNLFNGFGCTVDMEAAMSYWARAANLGAFLPAFHLGKIFLTADMKEAVKWFTLAAQAGRRCGDAEFELVMLYADSQSTVYNPIAARNWLKRLQELGNANDKLLHLRLILAKNYPELFAS